MWDFLSRLLGLSKDNFRSPVTNVLIEPVSKRALPAGHDNPLDVFSLKIKHLEHPSYRKSWKKEKLLDALNSREPDFVAQMAQDKKIARIKAELLPEIRSLSSSAHAIENKISFLCFAHI
jgi:hypothetical protein